MHALIATLAGSGLKPAKQLQYYCLRWFNEFVAVTKTKEKSMLFGFMTVAFNAIRGSLVQSLEQSRIMSSTAKMGPRLA